MVVKNKISIEKLIELKYKSRNSALDCEDAALTHYLQNSSSSHFKNHAISYIKQILNQHSSNVNGENEYSAEQTLQRISFDDKSIPFPANSKTEFSFIDLFAGVGGFRLALQNLNGKCIYSSEFEPNAKFTYSKNFGKVPFGDITKDETKAFIPKKFEILCGGFPCQAFSIAGLRKGFVDTRGTLFFDLEEIISKHRPKVVFLENVKNLVTHDHGKTFKVILESLENKLGYKVSYKVLNSMTHANIPQNRERIFIIAFDPKQVPNYKNFQFPKELELTKSIHDILEKGKQDDIYYYKKDHPYYPELEKNMLSTDTVYQWRRVYVRENKRNVCPTLTANMGTGGHNVPLIKDDYGIRKLTPRECFSFQGYPSNYVLPNISNGKLYMQAGNSVTVPLIQRIATEILKVM